MVLAHDADVSDGTRLFAVLGSPIAHSLSPLIHKTSFAHLSIDADYRAFEVTAERIGEAIDDIRYATLLKTTALRLVKGGSTEARYAARIALKLLADAKGDDYDLATFRYEMINHIQKLRAFEAK